MSPCALQLYSQVVESHLHWQRAQPICIARCRDRRRLLYPQSLQFLPNIADRKASDLILGTGTNAWVGEQCDISTAFLYADAESDTYCKQPPGYAAPGQEDWVLRLKKSL